jgi:hypothetical protein
MTRHASPRLACAALPTAAHALNDNPHGSAFVVLYQCDGGKWMPVGYPAPFAPAASRRRACRGTARPS